MLFRSLPHARVVLEAWRADYNLQRPQSKLGWCAPADYARAWAKTTRLKDAHPGRLITTGFQCRLDEKRGHVMPGQVIFQIQRELRNAEFADRLALFALALLKLPAPTRGSLVLSG